MCAPMATAWICGIASLVVRMCGWSGRLILNGTTSLNDLEENLVGPPGVEPGTNEL